MKKEKEIIYFRESFIQSVLSDIVTYGLIAGLLLFNRYYLGDKTYIGILFIVLWLIILSAKNHSKTFTNKEEFKKYIDETL